MKNVDVNLEFNRFLFVPLIIYVTLNAVHRSDRTGVHSFGTTKGSPTRRKPCRYEWTSDHPISLHPRAQGGFEPKHFDHGSITPPLSYTQEVKRKSVKVENLKRRTPTEEDYGRVLTQVNK